MKCLPPLLVAVCVLSILDVCRCKPTFGIDKVLAQSTPEVTSETDNKDEAQPTAQDKREWSKFATWGKRGWNKNFAVWGRKRWGNFATWGKRSGDTPDVHSVNGLPEEDKRGWYKFNTWGKRDDAPNADRKWHQFSVWGKRDQDGNMSPEEKRKWASQFATWGKRSYADLTDEEKRQWSQFATWGKRYSPEFDPNGERMAEDKRQWSNFNTWGKRAGDTEGDGEDLQKRKWAGFQTWGKRRWEGLATWGKRSGMAGENLVDASVTRLLRMFDENSDETLDRSELRNFMMTLMSLPSTPEAVESQ